MRISVFPLLASTVPLVAGIADTILRWLEESHGLAGYGIMLMAFLVGSIGFPLPEEAVLAMGGYLASTGQLPLLGVYFFGYGVVLCIDWVLFEVGRRAGPALEHARVGRRVSPQKWAAARSFFERRGVMAVVFARFVMGTRIPTFLLAGALGVSRRRYLTAVALSGLVSNAIPVALGYFLADHIRDVLRIIDRAHGWFGGVTLVLLLLLLWFVVRRRRPRAPTAPARPAPCEPVPEGGIDGTAPGCTPSAGTDSEGARP